MKYIFKLSSVVIICLLIIGCSKEKIEDVEYSIDETNIVLENGLEGSTDILIKTNTNDLNAIVDSKSQDWLFATITKRCLTLSYSRNNTGEERVGEVSVHFGLKEIKVIVTMPPYFNNEEVKGYSVGDVYYEENKAVGIVFWVDEKDRSIAKIASLDRLKGAWSSIGTSFIGAYSTVDGKKNTEILESSEEGKNGNIPALDFCKQHGEGWYWPAVNELVELFEAYNGTSVEEASSEIGGNENEKVNRANFDKKFIDNGGIAMDLSTSGNGESYWASTEDNSSEGYAKYGSNVRFAKFAINMGNGQCKKTGTSRYIRCVKRIGNYIVPDEPVRFSIILDKQSIELENQANDEQMVSVTITGGHIVSVSVDDPTWCAVKIKNDQIIIQSLLSNPNAEVRTTNVQIKVLDNNGIEHIESIVVTQKAMASSSNKYSIGQYYEDGSIKGIVFWVSDDGESAKIVSLTRSASTVAWSTEGILFGTSDAADGVGNTSILLKAGISKIPSLSMFVDGWYWPATEELIQLFEAYNGTKYDEATKSTPSGITQKEKDNRIAFDKLLREHEGISLNNSSETEKGDQYWSSTEFSEKYSSYVRFGNPYVGTEADQASKTSASKRYIRCIRQIGKNAKVPIN